MNFGVSDDQTYNNADSFAMAFDSAWTDLDIKNKTTLNQEEKIMMTFEKIKNHPFLLDNPLESKNIATFRIKLLGLS